MSAKNGKHPTSFWLDDEAKDLLSSLVEDLGMTRSAVVREAIKRMATDPQMAEIRRLVHELSKAVSRT